MRKVCEWKLSRVEASLPPGFRFHPRDDELISDYLFNKVSRSGHSPSPLIVDVDLNNCEPWDLPEMACVGGKEWYFYSRRERRYATGERTNRATASGYWKATGKDRSVLGNSVHGKRTLVVVGMRKTLVFYKGRAPRGKKTSWVMHEFRLLHPTKSCSPKENWVLCRVLCKKREIEGVKLQGKSNIMGSISNEDTIVSCSSSDLPPLMDAHTFDQSQPTNTNVQVPCFSMSTIPPNFSQMFNFSSPYLSIVNPQSLLSNTPSTTKISNVFNTNPGANCDMEAMYDHDKMNLIPCSSSSSSSYNCNVEKKIKVLLSGFNTIDNDDHYNLNFVEGISDQTILFDKASPVTTWYP